ncbi:hypothetical protein FIC_01560 [Flavobacteriaceae bacterium 3519-10]|nr:hypothetical protein FIC_01560 [Flavobacteriaceae bacterium 3519-10]
MLEFDVCIFAIETYKKIPENIFRDFFVVNMRIHFR